MAARMTVLSIVRNDSVATRAPKAAKRMRYTKRIDSGALGVTPCWVSKNSAGSNCLWLRNLVPDLEDPRTVRRLAAPARGLTCNRIARSSQQCAGGVALAGAQSPRILAVASISPPASCLPAARRTLANGTNQQSANQRISEAAYQLTAHYRIYRMGNWRPRMREIPSSSEPRAHRVSEASPCGGGRRGVVVPVRGC